MEINFDKVVLRKLQLGDANVMLDWMLNPEIYSKMQYDYKQVNIDKCKDFIKNSWDDKKNLHLAISNIKNDYLGSISLKNIDYKNKIAELGIVVHPAYSGRGIATLALYEIVKKAFFELELNKIYLYVRTDNKRAVLFYEKKQMELEGCSKEHLFIEGEYKDILWYSLRKKKYNEWKQQFKSILI